MVIVSRSSAKSWLSSTIVDVVCSGVKTARGAPGAPYASGCEEVNTRADVDMGAWGRAEETGGAVVDEGGTTVAEGGIDVADTKLIWTCTLPLIERRLYMCWGAGARHGGGAPRSREEERTEATARANSRLPREAE